MEEVAGCLCEVEFAGSLLEEDDMEDTAGAFLDLDIDSFWEEDIVVVTGYC